MKTKKNKTYKPALTQPELVNLYQSTLAVFKQHKSDLNQVIDHINGVLVDRSAGDIASVFSSLSVYYRKIDKNLSIKTAQTLTEKNTQSADAWLNLANTFDYFKDYKNALNAVNKILECEPSAKILVNAGILLSKFSQDTKAIECAKKGYALSGNSVDLASAVLRIALKNADWLTVDEIKLQLSGHYKSANFSCVETPRTHLLWSSDEALNIKVLSKFAEVNFPARESNYNYPKTSLHKRKLRIGFISYDYREHATSHLALGLLRHFNSDAFEYYAYCTSWDDGSAMRRDILNRFTKAKSIANKTDKEAADIINSDKIDILVDFNGLTEGTKMGVLAYKPAPIQMAYLGFPGTSGGRFIDYLFADDYTLPQACNQLYPEKIIRLPPTYQMNDYEAKWLPPTAQLNKTNLPNGKVVIGMFNNVNKVTPVAWSCWMAILNSVSDAVLWMLDPGEVAKHNLRLAALSHGVDEDKIIFAPKLKLEAHFARLQLCDFVLDPWPYGGHTTTADALFCAVPVVALEGCNFASRVSGGLLHAAGLKKLVATDTAAYVQLAIDLANNKEELSAIKQHLNRNRKRLSIFNAKHRTQQIEKAFTFAYNRYLEQKPAVPFRVI